MSKATSKTMKFHIMAEDAFLGGYITASEPDAAANSGKYYWNKTDGVLKKSNGTVWSNSTDSEREVTEENLSRSYDEIDQTDSATEAGATEFAAGRRDQEFTTTAHLYDSSGNKLTGLGGALNYDSSTEYIKSLSYSVEYSEIDVTDSETTASEKDFDVDRATRNLSLVSIARNDGADLADGVSKAVTVTLAAGVTIAGNMNILSRNVGNAIGDHVEVTYDGKFIGAPTETAVRNDAGATKDALMVVDKTKFYYGKVVGTNMSLELDAVSGETSQNHTYKLKDAMTEVSS